MARRRGRGVSLALAVLLGGAGAAWGAGVGVAPFEAIARQGESVPDVAAHLADRLATRELGTVRGPRELGADARFDPPAETVQAWARGAGVDRIVVGRTTKIGSQLSVHARVYDGTSGAALGGPLVEEVSRPEEFGRAIDRLTGALVERLGGAPRLVEPGGEAGPGAEVAAKPRKAPAGLRFDRNEPLSIRSDELEAAPDPSGQRRLVFAGHVRAEQGDLALVADRLEADYRAGANEPYRLQARGHVTIRQGNRVARCAEATFEREQERVVCTGQLAEIEQACDRVRGPRIVFHLGSERLEVDGGADVSLRPDTPGCGAGVAGEPGA